MMQKPEVITRENMGFLLAKASQRWNELLYQGFCAHGFEDVRPAFGSILVPLFEEDGLRMGELARRARLSKQTMTTLVRLAEARRLVARRPDPDDARASRIFLTARSKRFRGVAARVLTDLDSRVHRTLAAEGGALKASLKILMDLGRNEEEQSYENRHAIRDH